MQFEDISIEENPEQREVMLSKSNGSMTVPQIFIGETHVGGCDDLFLLESQGKLDPLLAN